MKTFFRTEIGSPFSNGGQHDTEESLREFMRALEADMVSPLHQARGYYPVYSGSASSQLQPSQVILGVAVIIKYICMFAGIFTWRHATQCQSNDRNDAFIPSASLVTAAGSWFRDPVIDVLLMLPGCLP